MLAICRIIPQRGSVVPPARAAAAWGGEGGRQGGGDSAAAASGGRGGGDTPVFTRAQVRTNADLMSFIWHMTSLPMNCRYAGR